ncbi:MAG: hypothetical protein M3437_12990 [Chloroflexota bacterium]|nr:hypothetical protein [Chloroflexota bacterium]MDQ5864840.1 hypothetical protein [Chloroflexota bacterium]
MKVTVMFAIATQSLAQTNIVKASIEFEAARRKSKRFALRAAIMRRPCSLVSMDELTNGSPIEGEHYVGLQQVPVRDIVGSVDRHRDFDANFSPRCDHTRQRWQRVANAHLHGTTLPAVQLIRINGVYMVEDGNHRVSVARHFGVEYIDAEVTEYVTATSASPLSSNAAPRFNWNSWAHLARAGVQAIKLHLPSRRTLKTA